MQNIKQIVSTLTVAQCTDCSKMKKVGQQQDPLELFLQSLNVSDPAVPELLFKAMQVCTNWRSCVLSTYNKRLPVRWDTIG